MTEQEVKDKIKNLLSDNMRWQHYYAIMRGIVYEQDLDNLADALIAAGYGDVKDLQARVDALEITNIALQAGYDGAEKDRLYWVNKYKEAEHRVEVYKRALHIAHTAGEFAYYVDKAEKELAEEGKDD